MMGLALRNVTLTLLCDGKPLFTEQGEALFTHFGLSGPLVLSASTYIEDITKHRYICEFDLKPALDEKTLYDRLTRDFAEQGAHSEPYLMLPEEYLRVSQCPNFILEEPFRIAEFIGAYAKNKAALFEKTDSMTIIGDNFKQRLKAVIGSVK